MRSNGLSVRGATWAVCAVVVLAVLSLVTLGRSAILGELLNSGTAWAGVSVLAGALVFSGREGSDGTRGFVASSLAVGSAAAVGSLGLHYAIGVASGRYEPSIFAENLNWFAMALVVSAPLGLAGALTHRNGVLGSLARLVVPVGAMLEPLVRSLPHAGPILAFLGAVGAVFVLLSAARPRTSRAAN